MNNLIDKDMIIAHAVCDDWKDAGQKAGEMLVKKGLIEERYIDGMFQAIEEIGMYIVIAPGIALFHARPEDGALETGLSLVTLKDGINFGVEDKDPVHLAFALAAKDKNSHLDLMASLSKVLQDSKVVNDLIEAPSEEAIIEILDKKLKEA